MNAQKLLTTLVLMIVFVSTARADIYDTRTQDEKRYGAPVGVETHARKKGTGGDS